MTRNPPPWVKGVTMILRGYEDNVRECLESERAVPEDADITRREQTHEQYAALTAAIEIVKALPESAQNLIEQRLGQPADELKPDLSTFDPWEGHRGD